MRDHIVIKGARENNLKNIDVEIPRDALVVMTGLSGSGKSSLAFDTIYAEGQRRYMESLVFLCAAVSRPDGQARRRLHRRLEPGHFHRPEDHQQKPAFDRRHGHGDLRLSASALGARRRAALPEVRQGDPPPDGRPDRRSDRWRCRRRRACRSLRRSSAHARASTRRCSTMPAAAGMSACAWTAASTTSRRRSRSIKTASTTSRSWSTASSSAPTSAAA